MKPPPEVIAAARAAQSKWRVPAAVSIAQWALESAWGKHLPAGSNNPFGIKARGGEPAVTARTREVVRGRELFPIARFRKFDSLAQAFDEHGRLLATNSLYAAAKAYAHDDVAYARAIAKHYATDPRYPELIAAIINGAELRQYDLS